MGGGWTWACPSRQEAAFRLNVRDQAGRSLQLWWLAWEGEYRGVVAGGIATRMPRVQEEVHWREGRRAGRALTFQEAVQAPFALLMYLVYSIHTRVTEDVRLLGQLGRYPHNSNPSAYLWSSLSQSLQVSPPARAWPDLPGVARIARVRNGGLLYRHKRVVRLRGGGW